VNRRALLRAAQGLLLLLAVALAWATGSTAAYLAGALPCVAAAAVLGYLDARTRRR